MNKRNAIRMSCLVIYIVMGISLTGLIRPQKSIDTSLEIKFMAEYVLDLQLFYSETDEFTEEASETVRYANTGSQENFHFIIPSNTNFLRLDFGSQTGNLQINEIIICVGNEKHDIFLSDMQDQISSHMIGNVIYGNGMTFTSVGDDPYIVLPIEQIHIGQISQDAIANECRMRKACMGVAIVALGIIFIRFRKKIYLFSMKLLHDSGLILDLAHNDFKTKFAGSYLGIVWAFVQPVVTIMVYWFVFQVGFRSGSKGNVPFVLWLAAGLVPWFFFNDALNSATSCLLDYSYLVKKVVFDIQIIPIVRILSAFFVHIFFVILIVVMFLVGGVHPHLTWLQLPYYSICLMVFVLGLSYATCALIIFFRDLGQIIIVALQIGIWITPIMWDWDIIPSKIQWLFKLNPLYYIVQGYRNALIYNEWFWNDTYLTIWFWAIMLICVGGGIAVFNKLRVHFADML